MSSRDSFAVVVPVGPGEIEVSRLGYVIRSLTLHERAVRWVVLIDDDHPPRRLESRCAVPHGCSVVVLSNSRGQGLAYFGGMAVTVLAGLEWVWNNCDPIFVLKLDTDSLIIAPFAQKIADFLSREPNTGIAGVIGRTCNRTEESFGYERAIKSPLVRLYNWYHEVASTPDTAAGGKDIALEDSRQRQEHRAVGKVVPLIRRATAAGYSWLHYCQGGAYAVSPEMLTRLGSSGLFKDYSMWADIRICEDVIVSMYAYTTRLTLNDYSEPGEPFGLRYTGLPFPPDEIVRRGHSIVHSIKNDPHYSEDELREYFSRASSAGHLR